MNKIDVVVPVYDGWKETVDCIESVLKTVNPDIASVVIINDASPSEKITRYLRDKANCNSQIKLLENSSNLGFVATVNRGMCQSEDRDVLLLNSDVIVANNWLERIRVNAYSDSRIGTVTPFSNNATICSFPNFCEENDLVFGASPKQIDQVFSQNKDIEPIDVPTGVGFCMYIRRDCLQQVGLFDVSNFGKGYGEENDFCMRANKLGWRNVLAPNVFVNHLGGVSFGTEKQSRIEQAVTKINQLYPGYEKLVHDHIHQDPGKPIRIAALTKLCSHSSFPTILFITHNLGGGVARHVNELATYFTSRFNILCLRPLEVNRVELTFFDKCRELSDKVVFDVPEDYALLSNFCKAAGVAHIHFHHTLGLPERIWGLMNDLAVKYDITLHDYYLINTSPTLTDGKGQYQTQEDKILMYLPSGISVKLWRETQEKFLRSARLVIAPSESAAKIYQAYFPNVKISCSPHLDLNHLEQYNLRVKRQKTNTLRIGILGAVGLEKGADVLEQVALQAKRDGLALAFILIGYAYRPLSGLTKATEAYSDKELLGLISDNQINLIWFPATWPETYSYTLSAALESRLPIVAPCLGAFIERLAGRPLTRLIDNTVQKGILDSFESLRKEIQLAPEVLNWAPKVLDSIYDSEYHFGISKSDDSIEFDITTIEQLLSADSKDGRHKSYKERCLLGLYRLRNLKIFSLLAKIIPMSWQRWIKRSLSRKPIHELLK